MNICPVCGRPTGYGDDLYCPEHVPTVEVVATAEQGEADVNINGADVHLVQVDGAWEVDGGHASAAGE
jgi:hypothetical protein